MLDHEVNRFNGIEIEAAHAPEDPECFAGELAAALAAWEEAGRELVWLRVPIERAALIPVATAAGFRFHHSQEDYVMLVRRLRPDALVPHYATHYIGAGGVVLNSRGELLVVSERHRRSARPYYKLPGGALHPGEHLVDAVIREVREETGVHARFEALVCFRHWHGYRYGKSDIYFICRLTALSDEIIRDEREIEECLWMPVEKYLHHELVSPFNRSIVQAALTSPGLTTVEMEGYNDPERREFFFPNGAAG